LYFAVKNFLAADGPGFVLGCSSRPPPKAVYDIDRGEDDLREDETDGLASHALEHIASAILFD
jgi:hypothetical protein